MLEANRRGKSGNMLREALNRGFTTTYLDEALTSLKRIVTTIQRWSVVKWAIISSIVIYLLLPLYTAFNGHWQQDAKNIYMTPLSQWDTQQRLLFSLQLIAQYCGPFIIIMAVIIPTLGYVWRLKWIKWRLNEHLAKWSIDKGILRSNWLSSLILTSIFTAMLLIFNPIWMTQDGLLFGTYPFGEQIRWMLKNLYFLTK
ncbi:hypothetical protein KHDHEBDM_04143 [Pectobacterium polaris]|nr:hypothetical protein KHDHEBDM_04143 [Pectobacterium polaris]